MVLARVPQLTLSLAAGVLLIASVVGLVRDDDDREQAAGPTAEGTVAIADFTFDPSELTAAVGDTVTWTNKDGVAHTVTSEGEGRLGSGDIEPGALYEATFDQAGTFSYMCTIHPTMQGTVEVTQ
ncbi:MAG: cupredoxin domain-containing protein [Acidimicrobiales bacterium]